MPFSAYQIESLLDDFSKHDASSDHSISENLTLSQDSLESARQHVKPIKKQEIGWVTPQNILEFIEDQSEIDLVLDYEQQRRAGQFVYPPYVPENPSLPISLVTDHVGTFRKNKQPPPEDAVEESTPEALTPEIQVETGVETEAIVPETVEPETAAFELESEPTDFGFVLEPEAMEDAPTTLSLDGDTVEKVDADLEVETETESTESTTETKTAEVAPKPVVEASKETKPEVPTTAALLDEIDDEEDDDYDDDLDDGLRGEVTDDSDVVFGTGKITPTSMTIFVDRFPDSAVKFLLRRNLDGRPIPAEFEDIYASWEGRGLLRPRLKKYLMKVMNWTEIPDIPIHEVVQQIREQMFILREKK